MQGTKCYYNPKKIIDNNFVLVQQDQDFFSPLLQWIKSHKLFLLACIFASLDSFGQDLHFVCQAL